MITLRRVRCESWTLISVNDIGCSESTKVLENASGSLGGARSLSDFLIGTLDETVLLFRVRCGEGIVRPAIIVITQRRVRCESWTLIVEELSALLQAPVLEVGRNVPH